MVSLNGYEAAPLLGALSRSSRHIIDSEGEFEVASAEMAKVCGALMDYEASWHRAANWGEVFSKEEQAGDYGAEAFSDLSQRYLSSGEGLDDAPPASTRPPQNIVVMLTVAYLGEEKDLETPLTDVQKVKAALKTIVALHHRDGLQLAHLHYAPAHFGDDLNEDQLLINYPELVAL